MELVKKTEMAPAPERGNAKAIFAVLADYGDIINESDIISLMEAPLRHSVNVSMHTSFKSGLQYLVTHGYAVFKKEGRARRYKIATKEQFDQKQSELAAPREFITRGGRKRTENPTAKAPRPPRQNAEDWREELHRQHREAAEIISRGTGRIEAHKGGNSMWPIYLWMGVITILLLAGVLL